MQTIRRGLAPEREATILQVFLQASGYTLNPDGQFGDGTDKALRTFQLEHGLIVDGVAGQKTWTKLFSLHPGLLEQMSAKWLSQQDIETFADNWSLEVAVVRTVYRVESGGLGFVGIKPKILFEGHVFWKQLQKAGIDPKKHVQGNRDILFPSWQPTSYVGGLGEHARLERAMLIDPSSALRSASWGLFQILGLHSDMLGYTSVQDFVAAMTLAERDQLDAFGRFISVTRYRGKPLLAWLKAHEWASFAAGYNGPGYARNKYDIKLAQAYHSFDTTA